jgi:hypothetical protein
LWQGRSELLDAVFELEGLLIGNQVLVQTHNNGVMVVMARR